MNIPVVPLAAFTHLVGAALAEDLRRLLAHPEFTSLVLFSDASGEQLAILPVGPGQSYECVENVEGVEIEGLRPLCALPLRGGAANDGRGDGDVRTKELDRLAESLKGRERYIEECERRLAEVGQNLSEREAMLEQREQQLLSKERDFFRRSGDVTRQAAEGPAAKRLAAGAQG